jgi:hypothetical protein
VHYTIGQLKSVGQTFYKQELKIEVVDQGSSPQKNYEVFAMADCVFYAQWKLQLVLIVQMFVK